LPPLIVFEDKDQWVTGFIGSLEANTTFGFQKAMSGKFTYVFAYVKSVFDLLKYKEPAGHDNSSCVVFDFNIVPGAPRYIFSQNMLWSYTFKILYQKKMDF